MSHDTSKTSRQHAQPAFKLHHLVAGFMTLALTGCDGAPTRPGATSLDCSDPKREVYALSGMTVTRVASDVPTDLDLDHDGRPDAALDGLMEAVAGSTAPTVASEWQAHLDAALFGPVHWLVVVDSCGDSISNSDARVRLVRGVDADEDGVFEIDEQDSEPAAGRRHSDGAVEASDGAGYAPLGTLFDASGSAGDPGWTRGEGVSIVLGPGPDSSHDVELGLAFADPLAACASPLTALFDRELQAGRDPLGLDTNHDGRVVGDELSASSLLGPLFAPDVDLLDGDGAYWPGHDHVDESTSLTLRGHAHQVAFE